MSGQSTRIKHYENFYKFYVRSKENSDSIFFLRWNLTIEEGGGREGEKKEEEERRKRGGREKSMCVCMFVVMCVHV